MTKAIYITVRTASTRLHNKALLKINNKPTIEYVIDKALKSKMAEHIVLCTTELNEDEVLCKIAKQKGINFYRGSIKDKLDRWNGASAKFDIKYFITADGDDLFSDPELIDLAFKQFDESNCDFIEEIPGKNVPVGVFTYGIKVTALNQVCKMKDSDDTEMMSVYFTNTNLFSVEQLKNIPGVYKRPEIRMTLDYKEDYIFFKTIIENFSMNNKKLDLKNILYFLDSNPEVIKINQFRQKDYLLNQKKQTNLKIKRASK